MISSINNKYVKSWELFQKIILRNDVNKVRLCAT